MKFSGKQYALGGGRILVICLFFKFKTPIETVVIPKVRVEKQVRYRNPFKQTKEKHAKIFRHVEIVSKNQKVLSIVKLRNKSL